MGQDVGRRRREFARRRADDHEELGSVGRGHDADNMEIAEDVASRAPQALRMTKALLRQGRDATFDQILEMTASMQALAHLSDDHQEGVTAALEKRAAVFERK